MSGFKKIKSWLSNGFKLMLYSSSSLEQKKKWGFNRLGFISFLLFVFLLIAAITVTTIVLTPLKYTLPGFTEKETQEISIKNATRLDSLEHEIKIRDQYITNIKQVLLGEKPFNPDIEIAAYNNDTNINFPSDDPEINNKLISNSPFKSKKPKTSSIGEPASIKFFPPVEGIVTNSFNPLQEHFGTDIVSPNTETVHSVLNGTVILANWTMETGYTVQIQHPYGYISVYRHLKKLMVKTGDKLTSGQVIGVYGNTGEISFGPHLHFELWKNGKALDPEKHIKF